MKPIIFILVQVLFLGISPFLYAQKGPSIKFKDLTYDYGKINEADGAKECTFEFTNTGNEDLIISNVAASCGCTTSDYTKTPVKPGKKGFIKAVFDPTRRPGPFHKSLTVMTNDPNNQVMNIFIRGEVIPKPKTKEDTYPIVQGNIRFMTNHASIRLSNNQVYEDTLRIFNPTNQVVQLSFRNLPQHINSIRTIPERLRPNAEGIIVFTYDAKKKNDFGHTYDRIQFHTGDADSLRGMLFISANIHEDFTWMTAEDRLNAPKAVFDNETFRFEKATSGDVINHDFLLTNKGKSPLIIRKVRASCGCTATTPDKTTLKPGESTSIKTAFNSAGRKGNQHQTITVITNDPERSSIVLTMSGTVLEKVEEIKGDPSKGEGSVKIYKAQ